MVSGSQSNSCNLTGFQSGLAGACAGVVTRFMVQPLDVIKIRFQLQIEPIRASNNSTYSSIVQAIVHIIKKERIFGLWKGHIPGQYLSVVFGAVQFSTFEQINSYFHKTFPVTPRGIEHLLNIGSGSIAGLTATIASFPFDVIRTYLVYQTEPKIYKGMMDVIIKIYAHQGLRGFSKGITAACFQTVPMSGLVFCFHGIYTNGWEMVFEKETRSTELIGISTTGNLTIGLLAGFSAKTLVYPFDLMKKRLQIQGFEQKNSLTFSMYKCSGLLQCFKLTLKNEGFLGLFKGFFPSLLKAGATTSLYFTVYNKFCQFLQYPER